MLTQLVDIREIDFTPYGKFYSLTAYRKNSGDGWMSWISAEDVIEQPMRIGFVQAGPMSYEVKHMERHVTTKEVLICGDQPMMLAVAISEDHDNAEERPKAEHIRAVIMRPGDVVVLNQGIWHDACYGLDGECSYYFLYTHTDEPVFWMAVEPAPCHIDAGG